jgi:hypothetical protein
LLWVAGILAAAFPAIIWSVMLARGERPPDALGWTLLTGMTVVLGSLATVAFAAARILRDRSGLGRALAWPVAIACLPGFPLFTIVGVLLVRTLASPGLRAYFAADRTGTKPQTRMPMVLGVGAVALIAIGIGAWLLLPAGGTRQPAVVQAPAIQFTTDCQQRTADRLLAGNGQAGLCTMPAGGKGTPHFDRYDIGTGQLLGHVELTEVPVPQQMALSPDGAYLAVAHLLKVEAAHDSAVTIWSLADRKVVLAAWKPYPGAGFMGNLSGLTFLDANHLLTVTRGGQVAAWDLKGKARFSVRHEIPGSALGLQEDIYSRQPQNFAWSADRKQVALFNGEGFLRLDSDTGAVNSTTGVLAPKGTTVRGTALDRAGKRLAVCIERAGQEELSVWDFAKNQSVGPFALRCAVRNEGNTSDWTSTALTWWDPGYVLIWNGNLDAIVVSVASGAIVRHLVNPPLGKQGFVDAAGRVWYEVLVTNPGAKFLVCAVEFPADDLQRYTGLEQGKHYPLWMLTRAGIETQPAAGFQRIPRVGPR